MREFYFNHQAEILGTLITFVILLVTRMLSVQTIRRISRISDLDENRGRLIIKYVLVGHSVILVIALILIWGVPIKEIGTVLASIFAVIGVALFASWSILSNITAGVILFFTFPFKIGDRIRILDKDLPKPLECVIEDIRAFHLHLRKSNGELVTYPNALMLQKAVALITREAKDSEGSEAV